MSMILNLLRVSQEQLDEYLNDSSALESRIDNNEGNDPSLIDIDKSWEGILFLLTGQNLADLDHPNGAILFSGQTIDEEQDLGYGPAQYLNPAQVKLLYEQLLTISTEEAKQRYDPVRMTELSIYPSVWDRNNEEVLDYLMEYFEEVKSFYAAAVESNQAVITFMH